MKLLIILFAVGIIGVIGTVEYSHAQTSLTLEPIPSGKEILYNALSIYYEDEKLFVTYDDEATTTHRNVNDRIGHIYFPPDTYIRNNTALLNDEKLSCVGSPYSVKDLLKTNAVSNLTVPSNIQPNTNDSIIAMGFDWTEPVATGATICPVDLEAYSQYPIITTEELRISLYNQHDKKTILLLTTREHNQSTSNSFMYC